MEYIIVIIICIVFLLILKFAWNIKIKDIKMLKQIGYSEELNKITNKLPENKEICKSILKKIKNEAVNIKESQDKNNKTSLYLVMNNTILIANIKDTFTRVQTIAHECIHSMQNRKALLFNFIYSNIYFLYFLIICILSIFKINKYGMLCLFTLTILSFIYYAIRSYLEMDAMIKAKYLAKEYMEEEGTLNKEEQKSVIDNYERINKIGIKLTNYNLIFNCTIKIIIYAIILIIVH